MKFTLILLICCFCAIYADDTWPRPCEWNRGNGEPACNAAEVAQVKWRNNWDPTAYWVCSTVGAAATAARCDVKLMFDVDTGTCINWDKWVWSFECNPPSVS